MSAESRPRRALIGAGANLGDRRDTIEAALGKLRATAGVSAVERSSFFETAPVGVTDQPAFLNLVAGIETTLTPEQLMAVLLEIERELGRVRTVRWGPRTIDLDLLAFEGETRATAGLTLPHPRMLERSFVTVPLRELLGRESFRGRWADLRAQLGAAVNDTAVRRLSDE